MVVQFGNAAQRLLAPQDEAEPPPAGEIDLSNGNGLVKGMFTTNRPEAIGSDAY